MMPERISIFSNSGTVVPTAVEQHDLAAGRQMRYVTLEIPLGAFPFARRRQRRHAADPRVEALGDALDDATLAGRVAALEQDDQLELLVHDPVLQFDQLALQPKQFLEIEAAVQIGNPLAGGGCLGDQLVHAVVIDFHFQFFVETVEHFGRDAPLELQFLAGLVCAHPGTSCRVRHRNSAKSWNHTVPGPRSMPAAYGVMGPAMPGNAAYPVLQLEYGAAP
jgi:hypothetical protein